MKLEDRELESQLTCSAPYGRNKYYFNKTINIHDETLNEYLLESKYRMSRVLGGIWVYLEDEEDLDLIECIRSQSTRFSISSTKLIESNDVDKFIKLFKKLLNKESEFNQSTKHPILEMYSLMNEFYDKYFEGFRNGTLIEKKEKEIEESITNDIESEEADVHAVEGKVKYYFIKKYERNPQNRILAIKKHGLNCYVCDFNFGKVYGKLGEGFIEVHHIVPLSSLNEEVVVNPETDLVPLCANCHRMIHKGKGKVLSVDELKQIVKSRRLD